MHRPQLGLRIPFESGPSRGVAVRGVSRYIFTIPRCSQSISFLQCLNLYFSISKATTRSVRGTAAPSARLSTPSTSTTTSGPSSPPTRDRLAPVGRCCAAESRRPPSARRLRPPPSCPSAHTAQADTADGHQRRHPEFRAPRRCVDAVRPQWRCGVKKRINLN